ncbi:glycoside hydrolase [bacterium BD-1]|uniref:sialidase family protein n=1 Tax=Arenimonas sp. TaxID=1872635 RepID=UPI001E325512|nr:glycoside hydrolase [Ottowia caeni]
MKPLLIALLALAPSAQAATVTAWTLPAPPGSAQPNLSVAPDGGLLLSWIERRAGGGHRLAFARHDARTGWSPARPIAEGGDWFVNWADFPALQALPDGSLWAHTLVKNADATYAYDVRLQSSRDGGQTWAPTAPVHEDGTPTEHGFATLWAQPDGRLGIAWLDGRHTGGGGHGGHAGHGEGGGMMTLRAASFGAGGKHAEREIDASTCDCCQTDSVATEEGVLLAYRDRTAGEVRDIAVARFDGRQWHAPVMVHADRWVMPACPVNGPAIAARGRQAWVAWYTAPGGMPAIRLARSDDGGRRFTGMKELARGEAQQGRLDLAADAAGVWVAWVEEQGGAQSLWLARFDPGLATEHFRTKVADIAGRGRATGFPRLRLRDGQAWLAWTEVVGGVPRLRGARVAE